MKVVVGASSFDDQGSKLEKMLQERDILLVKNPYGRKLTKEETIAHLQGATGLLAGLEPLDGDVFDACPDLKVIARIGIGMDNVDLEAAKKHGIRVSNTPDEPAAAVAEMTITMLLALLHQVKPSDRDVHEGIWKKRMGASVRGCKVLVIGAGRIGTKVTQLLRGFGAVVKCYDKYNSTVSEIELDKGLQWADAVTLHVSGTDQVIGYKEIDKMKRGAFLLNSARGGVVNESALYEALTTGKLAGFWGDALWEEPYFGKIVGCETAFLTPHICTYTVECRERMEMRAVQNLLNDLDGREGYINET